MEDEVEKINELISNLEMEYLKVSRQIENFYLKARVFSIPAEQGFLRSGEMDDAKEEYVKIKRDIQISFSDSLEKLYDVVETGVKYLKIPKAPVEKDMGFDKFKPEPYNKEMPSHKPPSMRAFKEDDYSPEDMIKNLFDPSEEEIGDTWGRTKQKDVGSKLPPKNAKIPPKVNPISKKEADFINKAAEMIWAKIKK